MKNKFLVSAAIIFGCLTTNCPEIFAQKSVKTENSIFTVDFAKAKEGEYENYLEFLRQNWVRARIAAKKKNYIKSFQLLVLPKVEVNNWHFILITEYGTKKQFDEMEKNFAEIFKKQGVKLIKSKSSREMADIVISKEFTSPMP